MSPVTAAAQVTSFAHTFLLTDGVKPKLEVSDPSEALRRKKRAHRKSRNGCITCKRRKVKCDEKHPCGNCVKRKELCSNAPSCVESLSEERVTFRLVPELSNRIFSSGFDADERVNLLHMELFYHFEKVTVPTLSFDIWPHMLQLSFQWEYLMNAMLSLAATHLTMLCPNNERYNCAAMSFLTKSIQDFRTNLSAPITLENCDPLMGTAILIHYLSWCNLEFLEIQPGLENECSPEIAHLDLAKDQMFLLSPGVRQIFFVSWPFFQRKNSVFVEMALLKPCNSLEYSLEPQNINFQINAHGFTDIFDDPVYSGNPRAPLPAAPPSTPSSSSPPPEFCPSRAEIFQLLTMPTTLTPDTDAQSSVYPTWDLNLVRDEQQEMSIYPSLSPSPLPRPLTPQAADLAEALSPPSVHGDREAVLRAAYDRVVARLSVVLCFMPDAHFPSTANLLSPTPVPMPQKADLEKYILSFPLLCFGPFLELILAGDSRALAVLYHFYRAARVLLPTWESWWCGRRASVMETLIRSELEARGLDACIATAPCAI